MRRPIREWKLSNSSQRLSLGSARAAALRHCRRVGVIAAVVALHGAVLGMLGAAIGPRPAWRPPRASVPMAQVDPAPITWADIAPVAPRPSIPMPPAAQHRTSGRIPVRAPGAMAAAPEPDRPAPVPRTATSGLFATAAASVPAPVTGRADAPSSAREGQAPAPEPAPAPAPLQRTLRKEALRDLASERRPWQDDPRLGSHPPASVGSRLAAGTAEAARSDCLRGEFKGNGMGLLSLPMMGLAAAQGRCRMP